MARAIRAILAVMAGLALAFGLIIAVEAFSAVVHPTPPEFTGTQEEMCEHVARYPQWVLAVVVIAWSATGIASTWVATRLGGRVPGLFVLGLLLAAVAFNVAMLPYATWFKVVMPVGYLAAGLCGLRLASSTSRHTLTGANSTPP